MFLPHRRQMHKLQHSFIFYCTDRVLRHDFSASIHPGDAPPRSVLQSHPLASYEELSPQIEDFSPDCYHNSVSETAASTNYNERRYVAGEEDELPDLDEGISASNTASQTLNNQNEK